MKRCPKCNRTYADDAFTFCLEDGALLSAPYDPEKKEEPISTIQSSGPPPTAVLPAESASKEMETKSATPPPTIASPALSSGMLEAKPFVPPQFETNAEATTHSKLPYIIISLLALVILLGSISLFIVFKRAQCPKVKIDCGQFDPSSAHCTLNSDTSASNPEQGAGPAICSLHPMLALQAAALPKGVDNVIWSTSLGKIDRPEGGGTSINTIGLSGRTITVTARFTADGWMCSNTATTSFVAK